MGPSSCCAWCLRPGRSALCVPSFADLSVFDDRHEIGDPWRWAHLVRHAFHDALLDLLFDLAAYGIPELERDRPELLSHRPYALVQLKVHFYTFDTYKLAAERVVTHVL